MSTSWVPLTLGAASPVVISAGGVVSGVSLFTDWSVKLAASLPAASCTTLPVAGLVSLTLTCSRFSTARLSVSVTVLFAALTMAPVTVMGVPVTLVTEKPALPGGAPGSSLLPSVELSTSWVPLTLGAVLPVMISTGGVVSGVLLFTAWPVKSSALLPKASCTTLPVVGLVYLTLTCSRFSTGRLRVSVMVLFAAFTLALLTVMGVLPGLVLVTVKPALPVRAAGSRLLASV